MQSLAPLPPPAGDDVYIEVKRRLEALDDPRRIGVFGARLALYTLPVLAVEAGEGGCWWYWKGAEQHLLSILRAPQTAWLAVAKPDSRSFLAARDASRAASLAAAYAARSETATSAARCVAEATRAAIEAPFAPYAAVYAAKAADLTALIRDELQALSASDDVLALLVRPMSPPEELAGLRETLLANLQCSPEFDYWADWLQARYAGRPLDLELLSKSVFLPGNLRLRPPHEINAYLKGLVK